MLNSRGIREMDEFVYLGSTTLCKALTYVGLNRLAYDMGFKGGTGVFASVNCAVIGSDFIYYWGLMFWGFVVFAVLTVIQGVHSSVPE
jgi:hypothetical protein